MSAGKFKLNIILKIFAQESIRFKLADYDRQLLCHQTAIEPEVSLPLFSSYCSSPRRKCIRKLLMELGGSAFIDSQAPYKLVNNAL
jgi:hypothetical protein